MTVTLRARGRLTVNNQTRPYWASGGEEGWSLFQGGSVARRKVRCKGRHHVEGNAILFKCGRRSVQIVLGRHNTYAGQFLPLIFARLVELRRCFKGVSTGRKATFGRTCGQLIRCHNDRCGVSRLLGIKRSRCDFLKTGCSNSTWELTCHQWLD